MLAPVRQHLRVIGRHRLVFLHHPAHIRGLLLRRFLLRTLVECGVEAVVVDGVQEPVKLEQVLVQRCVLEGLANLLVLVHLPALLVELEDIVEPSVQIVGGDNHDAPESSALHDWYATVVTILAEHVTPPARILLEASGQEASDVRGPALLRVLATDALGAEPIRRGAAGERARFLCVELPQAAVELNRHER